MAIQELEIWAKDIVVDGVTETEQRRELEPEEFLQGWLRQQTVSTQQLNSLFYLLTLHASPNPHAPVLHLSANPIPDQALEMNGQSITALDNPNLFDYYGSTLPDITADAPTGFTYIVRNS